MSMVKVPELLADLGHGEDADMSIGGSWLLFVKTGELQLRGKYVSKIFKISYFIKTTLTVILSK